MSKIQIADSNKPHRCPECWSSGWMHETRWGRFWYSHDALWDNLGTYLPRKCAGIKGDWRGCGTWTLTTKPSTYRLRRKIRRVFGGAA